MPPRIFIFAYNLIKSILESDGRNNFIGAFQIDEYEKAFNLIPKELQLKICKEWRGDGGNTILHLATASPKLLKFFLDLYPSFERRAALDQKNNSGKTVLDIISGNSEKYQEIISFLPEQDRPVKDEVTDKTTAHVLHRGGGPNL